MEVTVNGFADARVVNTTASSGPCENFALQLELARGILLFVAPIGSVNFTLCSSNLHAESFASQLKFARGVVRFDAHIS